MRVAIFLDRYTDFVREYEVKSKEQSNLFKMVSGLVKKSSEQEHRADALAPSADEGRGKLRKATVSRKQASTRGCPNVETDRKSVV